MSTRRYRTFRLRADFALIIAGVLLLSLFIFLGLSSGPNLVVIAIWLTSVYLCVLIGYFFAATFEARKCRALTLSLSARQYLTGVVPKNFSMDDVDILGRALVFHRKRALTVLLFEAIVVATLLVAFGEYGFYWAILLLPLFLAALPRFSLRK